MQCLILVKEHYIEWKRNFLKYNNEPVGYCFTNLTTQEIANIPLLCISSNHKGKGLGAAILKNSVRSINNIRHNTHIQVLNTTCDTSNYAAINTYRKIGFKEKTYYTHAFMQL